MSFFLDPQLVHELRAQLAARDAEYETLKGEMAALRARADHDRRTSRGMVRALARLRAENAALRSALDGTRDALLAAVIGEKTNGG